MILNGVPCRYLQFILCSRIQLHVPGVFPLLTDSKQGNHINMWKILGDAKSHGVESLCLPKHIGKNVWN